MAWTKREQTEAIEQLRTMLKPGDTVYTTVKHVSRSGMYRSINVQLIQNNEPIWISRLVAKAINARYDDKNQAVGMSGCGMDMTFEVVYELGRVLFPNGFDVIGRGRNGDMSGHDTDGGYALKNRNM